MKLFGVRKESRERDYPHPHEAASPPFVGKWGILGYYLPAGLMEEDDAKRFLQGPHEGEVLYCCPALDTNDLGRRLYRPTKALSGAGRGSDRIHGRLFLVRWRQIGEDVRVTFCRTGFNPFILSHID